MVLGDGGVEVDNTPVERSIRPLPPGRENALVAGYMRPGRWMAGLWAEDTPIFDDAADEAFEPAAGIDDRLDEAAAEMPRATLLLRKIAQLRASLNRSARLYGARSHGLPLG